MDVCHVVHTTRFDILNKCDESIHDQWPIPNVKHWIVVKNFLIFANMSQIQIMN